MEGVVRGEHLLGLLDAGDEGLAVGGLEGLPDVSHRLALEPGGVGEHLAQRDPCVPTAGEVVADGVIEA